MALDTAQKRAAVPGVGRPWMRSISPDSGKGREWRSSVGLSYPVANFQGVGIFPFLSRRVLVGGMYDLGGSRMD